MDQVNTHMGLNAVELRPGPHSVVDLWGSGVKGLPAASAKSRLEAGPSMVTEAYNGGRDPLVKIQHISKLAV